MRSFFDYVTFFALVRAYSTAMQLENFWRICLFLVSIAAGSVIAGVISVPKIYRIQLSAFLIGLGVALAYIAFS